MKTIHVITLQNVANYGSVLQALATQEFFKSLGLVRIIINHIDTKAFLFSHGAFRGIIKIKNNN